METPYRKIKVVDVEKGGELLRHTDLITTGCLKNGTTLQRTLGYIVGDQSTTIIHELYINHTDYLT